MKCPVCGKDLVEYQAGSFNLDICRDGCSGMWFDKSEIDKCDEHHEPFPQDLLRVNKTSSVVVDRSEDRKCPKCPSYSMKRVVLDPEKRFEIDCCPNCEGHWLDVGELERMRRESKIDADIESRLAAFNTRVEEQLKDVDTRHRVNAFIKVLFH